MTTTTDNFLKEKEYRQPIRTRMSEFGDDEAAKTMYVLLLKDAVDTEQVLTVDDQVVVLHRGESIFGRFAYAKKMGLKKSESLRCTRILSRLVKTHNKVNIRALNRCTVVTIKDYDYEIIMKWRPDEAVKTSKSLFTNNKMNNRQSEERVDVTTQNNNEENEMNNSLNNTRTTDEQQTITYIDRIDRSDRTDQKLISASRFEKLDAPVKNFVGNSVVEEEDKHRTQNNLPKGSAFRVPTDKPNQQIARTAMVEYGKKYRATLNEPHPNLKQDQVLRIHTVLTGTTNEFGLDVETWQQLIDLYFRKPPSRANDFNINLFAQEAVLKVLYQKWESEPESDDEVNGSRSDEYKKSEEEPF